jgi:hypothetical protein
MMGVCIERWFGFAWLCVCCFIVWGWLGWLGLVEARSKAVVVLHLDEAGYVK